MIELEGRDEITTTIDSQFHSYHFSVCAYCIYCVNSSIVDNISYMFGSVGSLDGYVLLKLKGE